MATLVDLAKGDLLEATEEMLKMLPSLKVMGLDGIQAQELADFYEIVGDYTAYVHGPSRDNDPLREREFYGVVVRKGETHKI